MKFISKLWEMFCMEIYHVPILIFVNLYKNILKKWENENERQQRKRRVPMPFKEIEKIEFSDSHNFLVSF